MLTERHVRSFSAPDDVIELESVRSEIVSFGGIAVAHTTHQPGWRWSTQVRPVALDTWLWIPTERTTFGLGAGDWFP